MNEFLPQWFCFVWIFEAILIPLYDIRSCFFRHIHIEQLYDEMEAVFQHFAILAEILARIYESKEVDFFL